MRLNKEVFKILKNILIHIRSSLKLILIIAISTILIIGIISTFYKPTYAVTLNGEFMGYTNDKNELQKQINEYMQGRENENIAFVDVESLPEYSLCFVKKNNVDSTEQIVEKIKTQGTTYYECYAVTLKEEEKYYVTTKEEAEEVIETLKKKDSNNIKNIAYTQVYSTEPKEYSEKDTIVSGLYEKKKPTYTVASAGGYGVTTEKLNLGVGLIKPISSGYTITSRFGTRSSGMHKGLDIAAPTGTAIHAAAAGTVASAGWSDSGYGYFVLVTHTNGVQTLYGHCSSIYVSAGQYVEQGQSIAAVGSTGWSTGPHLHLEIRVNGTRVNPQYYLY